MALAVAQFTISDFHDIYTAPNAPSNPTLNQLWCDTSVTPSLLKRWNGTEWNVVNDNSDLSNQINGVTTRVSSVEQTMNSFKTTVSETYTTKSEFTEFAKTTSTQFEQTSSDITIKFTEAKEMAQNGISAEKEYIESFVRFVGGRIELGEVGDEFSLKISKEKIAFLKGNNEIAHMNGTDLQISRIYVEDSLRFGNFAFLPEPNGSVSLKKVV